MVTDGHLNIFQRSDSVMNSVQVRRQLRRPDVVRNEGEGGGDVARSSLGEKERIISVRPKIKKILAPMESRTVPSSARQGEGLAQSPDQQDSFIKRLVSSSSCLDSSNMANISKTCAIGVEEMDTRIARLEMELDLQKRLLYLESIKLRGDPTRNVEKAEDLFNSDEDSTEVCVAVSNDTLEDEVESEKTDIKQVAEEEKSREVSTATRTSSGEVHELLYVCHGDVSVPQPSGNTGCSNSVVVERHGAVGLRSDLVAEQLRSWQKVEMEQQQRQQEQEDEDRRVGWHAVEEQQKILDMIKLQQEQRRREEELSLKLIMDLTLGQQQDRTGSRLQSSACEIRRPSVPSSEEVAASLGIQDLGEQRRLWKEIQTERQQWNQVTVRRSHRGKVQSCMTSPPDHPDLHRDQLLEQLTTDNRRREMEEFRRRNLLKNSNRKVNIVDSLKELRPKVVKEVQVALSLDFGRVGRVMDRMDRMGREETSSSLVSHAKQLRSTNQVTRLYGSVTQGWSHKIY